MPVVHNKRKWKVNMGSVLVIAEAGVNHNGDLAIAKKLIDAAHACGADVVKFQTARVSSLVSASAKMADYQKQNIGKEESQKEMLEKLLLPFEDFVVLKNYCDKVGIAFLSTPFDIESIHFLDSMVPLWKVPSGEITNYPYLCEIGKTKKKVILSTGMSSLDEVEAAVRVLREHGTTDITLLQCTTEYPAPVEEVNLRAMQTMKDAFSVPVGYSDHTEGIGISLAAVALGATVIEKHFTLDKNMEGPDHKASASVEELRSMIADIRRIEQAMGTGIKIPGTKESRNQSVARKSIVALQPINAGEIFTQENLTTKRPGDGVSPMLWNQIIGSRAKRDFAEDEKIEL